MPSQSYSITSLKDCLMLSSAEGYIAIDESCLFLFSFLKGHARNREISALLGRGELLYSTVVGSSMPLTLRQRKDYSVQRLQTTENSRVSRKHG